MLAFSLATPLCLRPASTTLRGQVCVRGRGRVSHNTPATHGPVMHGPGLGGPQSTDHAMPSTTTTRRPGERKGFVEEMRFIAMKLHTKDQAREGEMETSALPIDAWYPSKKDFMQFLVDSRCIYEYFETELAYPSSTDPLFSRFANSGLERLDALDSDIQFLESLGVSAPLPTDYARNYVEYLRALQEDKPESVLCHWYNYYFAHSAGGRMIGRLMQERLFDGRSFAFYEWDSDVKSILNTVRPIIDEVAAGWSRELKDECLKETNLAFGYSGTVLSNLAKAE